MLTTPADLTDPQGNAAYLAEIEFARLNRFRPTPAGLADMHAALSYFNALSQPPRWRAQMIRAGKLPFSAEQRLIWWRMRGVSFSEIGKRLGGISYERSRQKYWQAIEKCERAGRRAKAAERRRSRGHGRSNVAQQSGRVD